MGCTNSTNAASHGQRGSIQNPARSSFTMIPSMPTEPTWQEYRRRDVESPSPLPLHAPSQQSPSTPLPPAFPFACGGEAILSKPSSPATSADMEWTGMGHLLHSPRGVGGDVGAEAGDSFGQIQQRHGGNPLVVSTTAGQPVATTGFILSPAGPLPCPSFPLPGEKQLDFRKEELLSPMSVVQNQSPLSPLPLSPTAAATISDTNEKEQGKLQATCTNIFAAPDNNDSLEVDGETDTDLGGELHSDGFSAIEPTDPRWWEVYVDEYHKRREKLSPRQVMAAARRDEVKQLFLDALCLQQNKEQVQLRVHEWMDATAEEA